jgi:hypothetical protein
MQSGRQFEYEVVLDSELDSNSTILNLIGSPPSHACNRCAHDHVIGPCISIEGMIVAEALMSSSVLPTSFHKSRDEISFKV